ncbi:hypothetical protein KFE25_011680 [Diacronema lutheri]|uniref:Ubiquitin-like domain-containing protein n=1 Tax=Diacronema lutheri TaxID=2081491 RepID=A0A8J5XB08_DIALT|nr:hypothetical protein KFE25_011656 [Diacronema lutheri]KAG8458149.1 hypothetical protein KFE25_011680 [Diacronema lutheri]
MASTVMTGTTSFSSRAPPGEETQTKLNALSNQFDNFFGDLEEETAVRKKAEDSRVTRIERELGRLEKAINVETRRRIEATKAIQLQYEEKLEAMQTSFREQIKASTDALRAEIRGLHDHIARLEARMDEERENREREIQRHNHDVLSKFDAHTKEFEIEKVTRLEREAQLLKRIGDEAFRVQQKIAQERIHRDGEIVQMKDEFWAATKSRDKADEVFKSEMLRKMGVVQRELDVETKARELSEEQLVNAINDYTKALQDGLRVINRTRDARARASGRPSSSREPYAQSQPRAGLGGAVPMMYVRVKRKNQTMFVYAEPSDTVGALKGKIEGIVQVSPAEMRLYADTESSAHAMADKDTLEKLGVQPEQALALVFKLPGTDDFEPIEIASDAAQLGDGEKAD